MLGAGYEVCELVLDRAPGRSRMGKNSGGRLGGEDERLSVGEHDQRQAPERASGLGPSHLGKARGEVDRLQVRVGGELRRRFDQRLFVYSGHQSGSSWGWMPSAMASTSTRLGDVAGMRIHAKGRVRR